jgi:hypothetical protein
MPKEYFNASVNDLFTPFLSQIFHGTRPLPNFAGDNLNLSL